MVSLPLPLRTPSLGLAPQTCCQGSSNSFMNLSSTSILTCLLCHFASDQPIDRHGEHVVIDGHSLSIPALVAVARHNAQIVLDDSPEIRAGIQKSRDVIVGKVETSQSVYGVSTGFGGSGKSSPPGVLSPTCDSSARLFVEADTRTPNTLALGSALLQHQHSGVLPSSTDVLASLPLLDPLASTSMPESWVRGAILVRINSLIRGHSGVRWELIEKMAALLRANITPLVPLRGSISASGGTYLLLNKSTDSSHDTQIYRHCLTSLGLSLGTHRSGFSTALPHLALVA
jgi:Aromatic amino acid lyase